MVYIIYICMAVPLMLMLPLLEKHSRWLIGFMLIGATAAVCSSEINGMIQVLSGISSMNLSLKVAPVIEECLKALAILLFAIFGSDDRKKVLSLAMATGIGFAILENTYVLIHNLNSVSLGWAMIRGASTSLMHGMCTFLVGCGIIYVRKQKKLFYTGTFGLLSVAITAHAAFNLLVYSKWDWFGLMLPIIIYVAAQCILNREKLKLFLCKSETGI